LAADVRPAGAEQAAAEVVDSPYFRAVPLSTDHHSRVATTGDFSERGLCRDALALTNDLRNSLSAFFASHGWLKKVRNRSSIDMIWR
jgi:hypothetical protein